MPKESSPATPPPAIEVVGLTKRFGRVKAIDGVSFRVEPGQVVGFLGPNGAGKSTTMRILCGLLPASSGIAKICGIPVASNPYESKRHVGYMPEHNPLPEDMRVVEYLRYRARLKEVPMRKVKARVDEAMEICDLQRKARRKVIGSLSKGYRQRVGIADTIVAEPEVIVMDEPTIGLDPHQILSIRNLIDSLRGRMSVIISSHILPEIEKSCDRVIIINQGRIVANGNSSSLRKEFLPQTTYRVRVNLTQMALKKALADVGPDLTFQSAEEREDGFWEHRLLAPSELFLTEPILEALQRIDARIREIARLQPNLEDIFMAATRRSWDETAAPFKGHTRPAMPMPKH
ncbi:ABC transporter ATP-binding protein [Cerasicoccus arenae]|uniref:Multidrug ABC transporter ATP-binding protein n=1 Tax=Cerasicoccus arenae TaxID=424488 RepID=A0A8J3DHD8_9BACT|nr:ABC transporter ATP-binding protein [Cerasicoccus arenae]MBK1858411.1 ABC transporter ATP-binding protein [Cerasicoccus arenae]GHC02375.1 multidrug ABC transporter ATP-binding protein [Cerasicoccus arenae]